ncbi:3-phosphoglycerate dehydrogenase [Knoellia sinensis KCTC 19936]|uniref:3-phosphoglycerate dehydrogenase n=1 Tax=Knoellia sinensis KCTC 19936 TaxID=1385520 RepID=A0A0A0J092_9MICO|nr:hydroxyacid dehydrogenase [Knoellia sinensis]KGN30855.1 3-phosphoglycerate dehydrogenase [Knoellia sinensis KCTC 19936]
MPRIAMALAQPMRDQVFPDDSWQVLKDLGRLDVLSGTDAIVDALPDVEVLVAGWGVPPLTPELLDTAPRLRLIAYVGAAVKSFATPAMFQRGVVLTQAGMGMARPVAEVALTFSLSLLHQIHVFDHALRSGTDFDATLALARPRHEIAGAAFGVVGASRVGRAYTSLAQNLGATVAVHDPYLDEAEAAALGVRRVGLDELMARSRIVALHAPVLPETKEMIGAGQLASMPDGSGLVNTARAWLIDSEALLAELRSGRIDAALDVFDDEPLRVDDPLRRLPNVLLTPHQAAGTIEGRARQGTVLLEEIGRYFRGEPLAHCVTPELLDRIA